MLYKHIMKRRLAVLLGSGTFDKRRMVTHNETYQLQINTMTWERLMQSELFFEWKHLFIMSSYQFDLKYEDVLNSFTLIRIFFVN